MTYPFDQESQSCASSAVLIDNPDRSRGDICPGTLKLHQAEDGAVGRVRFPGGKISAQQWAIIADIAEEFGDKTIHITTRGNMQFRGVKDELGFADKVSAEGLLPSRAHDKIRNMIASPLSRELQPIIEEVDRTLLSDDIVAGLSGRTLFGFDAGDGTILAHRPDFGVIKNGEFWQLILGGELTTVLMNKEDIPQVLLHATRTWQLNRGQSWRVHENQPVRTQVEESVAETFATRRATAETPVPTPAIGERVIGWINNADGTVTLGGGLRFGFLTSQVARVLNAVGAQTTISPGASLVIHDLKAEEAEAVVKVLAPMGIIFDVDSPWLKVTACTGLPGCAKSHTNTQLDATNLVTSGKDINMLVHFSGCDRRCGHPLGAHTEYVATGDGEYEVNNR
ncbi:precorrin-3B synthase [Corynebacterium kutscheri]|uniref:Precorrin-3B synthase n=1 Tax=Corynebacterium kutscheri TaxID=35755 RepID=A0A0F6R1R5_9CORY|nr:precorrin-3B synthase [Corynebacterium kutscheri]AKE41198.1 sulfite reductase, beta subunit (hemoprotein) [Corynebacterium kutscheri]VEH08474.1 precorrin-3B synthase [Corynebacterium kutscheri]VEH09520.1 precorrin-3B synthase [Corynebacterium kutscheri]VEH79603.1 precorrin-3B synthase [Corynebacterium kutscheri]